MLSADKKSNLVSLTVAITVTETQMVKKKGECLNSPGRWLAGGPKGPGLKPHDGESLTQVPRRARSVHPKVLHGTQPWNHGWLVPGGDTEVTEVTTQMWPLKIQGGKMDRDQRLRFALSFHNRTHIHLFRDLCSGDPAVLLEPRYTLTSRQNL